MKKIQKHQQRSSKYSVGEKGQQRFNGILYRHDEAWEF